MSHWENMANELVTDCLVRAACNIQGSLPGDIAASRLFELARIENNSYVNELLKQRNNFMNNVARIINSITSSNKK